MTLPILLAFDVANETLIGLAALVIIVVGIVWLLGARPWRRP
jgi:hypothetical protein